MVLPNIKISLVFAIFFLVFDVESQDCGKSGVANFHYPISNLTKTAEEGAWPWMVEITYLNGRNFTYCCNGFLIDHTHILTVAHCILNIKLSRYRARIGRVNQTEGEMYKFTRITIHEQYSQRYFYNDIAILTLDRSVIFPGFNPICLLDPEVNRMNLEGIRPTVVGWGTTIIGGESSLTQQQLSGIPVMSNEHCNKIYDGIFKHFRIQFPRGITNDIICAGFPEDGSCEGNSGGALMLLHNDRWYAIGIECFGISCGFPGKPSGYVKVSSYLDWISEKTRN